MSTTTEILTPNILGDEWCEMFVTVSFVPSLLRFWSKPRLVSANLVQWKALWILWDESIKRNLGGKIKPGFSFPKKMKITETLSQTMVSSLLEQWLIDPKRRSLQENFRCCCCWLIEDVWTDHRSTGHYYGLKLSNVCWSGHWDVVFVATQQCFIRILSTNFR